MNEKYERISADICWSKDTDNEATKLRLMQTYSKEDINEAHEYARELLNRLRMAGIETKLCEHNGYYGEVVHDCMCHMVAFGERIVNLYLEQPELAIKLFDSGGVVENFFCVFPSDEDYEMMNPSYHQNLVHRYLEELEEIKSALLFKYNPQFLKSEGGYDYEMAEDVLKEVRLGIKNNDRDYNMIYKSTQHLGHCALYANVWKDFMKFAVLG